MAYDPIHDAMVTKYDAFSRWEVKIEHKRLTRYLGLNKGTKVSNTTLINIIIIVMSMVVTGADNEQLSRRWL